MNYDNGFKDDGFEHDASDDVAPEEVQAEISALLRQHAPETAPGMTMPADVEARIRGALQAEMRRPARPLDEPARSAPVDADRPATLVALPRRPKPDVSRETRHDASVPPPEFSDASVTPRAYPSSENSPTAAPKSGGSNVASLDEHRRRRLGGKSFVAMGAAAATVVVAGALGTSQMVADKGPQSQPSQDAATFASRVRVTQSGTEYRTASLTKQAATLKTSQLPDIKNSAEAKSRLGSLVTPEGLHKCLNALDKALAQNPKRIYADFGKFNNDKAVIVVVEKQDNTSEVWVVKDTCTQTTDKISGPESITT